MWGRCTRMSPRTCPQRRLQGRDRQDACTLQRGVWPPAHRVGGTPSSPHVHAHPSPPSTGGTLATGTRRVMSSSQGQASQRFMSRLLQAASIFFIYLSPVSFLTGCFWGEGNGQKEGKQCQGDFDSAAVPSTQQEPWGTQGGGCPRDGAEGQPGTACTPQPVCHHPPAAQKRSGDRNGFAAREGKGWEAHTEREPAAGFNPILQAGRQRSWEALRATGEASWIKSLSFTWAGVQPQNSSPKTRSHERKKIARRRFVHTSLSYVGAERQPALPATVPLRSLRTVVPTGRCQLFPGIRHSPDARAHLRDSALLWSHP